MFYYNMDIFFRAAGEISYSYPSFVCNEAHSGPVPSNMDCTCTVSVFGFCILLSDRDERWGYDMASTLRTFMACYLYILIESVGPPMEASKIRDHDSVLE